MTTSGSDCPTGKTQYTKKAARGVRDAWRRRGARNARVYRCPLCETYHVGNTRNGRGSWRSERDAVRAQKQRRRR